jgi:hypothetical protein
MKPSIHLITINWKVEVSFLAYGVSLGAVYEFFNYVGRLRKKDMTFG